MRMSTTNDGTPESLVQPGAGTRSGLLVAGTYRLSTRIASGGAGDVYAAEHIRLGSPVAIKLLRADALDDHGAVERFGHEARRLASVRSPNVVRVYDYGTLTDGSPYLVMERLYGQDLRALLATEGPLPIRRAIKLVTDACRGLTAVHTAGFVHRDIKPANLFVESCPGGDELCKVLDFGVAKSLASDTTHRGALRGTVRYMAPEQLEDAASVTASADVYALGAILYEMITGVPVHEGESQHQVMFDILHRDARPPSKHCALPSELEEIVIRSLAREKNARFNTASAFASALAPFGPVERPSARAWRSDAITLSDDTRNVRRGGVRWTVGLPQRWMIAAAFGVGVGVGLWVRDVEPPVSAAEDPGARQSRISSGPSSVRSDHGAPAVTATIEPRAEITAPKSATSVSVPGAPSSQSTPAHKTFRAAHAPEEKKLSRRFDPVNPYE
jgi:serine/threonine protein kinase